MPRATSPQSESESERVPSKKQKKREMLVDDPMDEDEGEEGGGDEEEDVQEEEYEIERILDSSKEIFEDVCFICWPWFQGGELNSLRKKWRTS